MASSHLTVPPMHAPVFRFNSTHSHPVAKWPLIKQYWRTLLGTAGGWFLFDVTFYANGLFSSTIIEVRACSCSMMRT